MFTLILVNLSEYLCEMLLRITEGLSLSYPMCWRTEGTFTTPPGAANLLWHFRDVGAGYRLTLSLLTYLLTVYGE